MGVEIPGGYANMLVTLQNSAAGASELSTISLGMDVQAGWDQTVTNRVANIARDALKTIYDNAWRVGPVKFLIGPEPLDVWEDSTLEAGTATAADYASPAVAISVTKRTGIAGRAYRGRFYLPGVVETLVDEAGELSGAYLTDLQTAITAFKTNLEADAAVNELVLLHADDSPVATPTTITSLVVRTPAATMRPRQRR